LDTSENNWKVLKCGVVEGWRILDGKDYLDRPCEKLRSVT
jgi:hypothetical protein